MQLSVCFFFLTWSYVVLDGNEADILFGDFILSLIIFPFLGLWTTVSNLPANANRARLRRDGR